MENTNAPRDPTGEYARAYQGQIDEAQEVASPAEEIGFNFANPIDVYDQTPPRVKNVRNSKSAPQKKPQHRRHKRLNSFMYPSNQYNPKGETNAKGYPLTFLGTPISPPRYTLDEVPPAYDIYTPHLNIITITPEEYNRRRKVAGQKDDDEPMFSFAFTTTEVKTTQEEEEEDDDDFETQRLMPRPRSSKRSASSPWVADGRSLRRSCAPPMLDDRSLGRRRSPMINKPGRYSKRARSNDVTPQNFQEFAPMNTMNALIATQPHSMNQLQNGQSQLYQPSQQHQTHTQNHSYQSEQVRHFPRNPDSHQASGVQHQRLGFQPGHGFQQSYGVGIQHQDLGFQLVHGSQQPYSFLQASGVQHQQPLAFQFGSGFLQSYGAQQTAHVQRTEGFQRDVAMHQVQSSHGRPQMEHGTSTFIDRHRPSM